LIGVDQSKPDQCVHSLREWIVNIKTKLDSSSKSSSKKDSRALSEMSEEAAVAVPFFSIPVVVVVCNSEMFQPGDLIQMKRAKEIQGELRSICLEGMWLYDKNRKPTK